MLMKLTNPKNNPEQVLKRAICQWLSYNQKHCMFWIQESVGIWDPVRRVYRKSNSPFQRKGKSDILGIWKQRPLAIEVKIKPNKPTEEQESFLDDFKNQGGIAIVAYRLEDVVSVLSVK